MSDDPFERALKKEEELRRRSRPDTRRMIQMASWAYSAFMLGWAALLVTHYRFWPEPDWLRVVHTVVFGLVSLYWIIAMVFSRVMLKRYIPDELTDPEPPT
jgi:hypothetical protein